MQRRNRIGAIQELVAYRPALEDAEPGQQSKFPLNRTEGRSRQSGDLPDMKFLIGPAQ